VTLGALQMQNLLYLVGAVAVATLWISALYLLRHRKPRSMEAGIESFSRELRALAPDRRPPSAQDHRVRPSGDLSNQRSRARGTRSPVAGANPSGVGNPGPSSARTPADERAPIRDDE
jgi:hypothetical protein